VRLFDSNDIKEVINKMLVTQTKINISGGPSIGEILGRAHVSGAVQFGRWWKVPLPRRPASRQWIPQ